MDSASISFVLFGLGAALLSNFRSSAAWRTGVLLAASLVFVFLLDKNPLALLPLAGFLALGYAGMKLGGRGQSRVVTVVVLTTVFAYIWLKKYAFLPSGSFLSFPYLTLGLSYIFFRVLHLAIDAGDSSAIRKVGPVAYLAYTLNFTTLISGPIQRYEDFAADQLAAAPPPLDVPAVGMQAERLVRGFFKVNVLATLINMVRLDALARLTEALPASARIWSALVVTADYPLFLYANFSGYIDIVIAIARLMRLRLPENFDRPFSATSFIDFWNRWHITLSAWLKTYVYNPLLVFLMRRIPAPAMEPFLGVFSFFVTFFLIGIWHGRTSEFAIFGLLQGGGVAVNKLWQILLTRGLGRKRYRELARNRAYEVLGRGLTFTWFAFTLYWFWAGWRDINSVFASISAADWLVVWIELWLLASAVLESWEWLREMLLGVGTGGQPALLSRYARVAWSSAMALAAFVLLGLLSGTSPEIVYKAF
jgi:D-alanyl-lipoteichoic acid acyltransferase DltB (MBOAT superfamily)